MLEQVEGQRARAVEQEPVALLQVVDLAVGDLVNERVERSPFGCRHERLRVQDRRESRLSPR